MREPVSAAARSSVSRVGVRGLEAVLRLGVDGRPPQPFAARLDCVVEPGPARADTPRFEVVIRDTVRDVVLGEAATRVDRLAQHAAERVRERLGGRRAEAVIAARFPERRTAPVSGTPTQELSTLHGRAIASERGTRRLLGVSAQGMTTSPYVQDVLAARAHERLAAAGFSTAQIARVMEAVTVATHSQLSVGTLYLGAPGDGALDFDAAVLLEIVAGAMGSEIFELLKRSDEAAVVECAHRRPRFVEDCVRAIAGGVVERFAGAPGDVFVSATQRNVEGLRGHDVMAELCGLLGELRGEATAPAGPRSLRDWLAWASA